MLAKIKALEKEARLLEPSGAKRKRTTREVLQFAESFLQGLDEGPAFRNSRENGSALYDVPPRDEPRTAEELLSLLQHELAGPGLNPASGGHLGYIPGGGLYYAALGDFLAAVTNRYATVYYASPDAVRMENLLVRWMSRLVGYPVKSSGYLASGGSMANLSALVAARDAMHITSKNIAKSVIYCSSQTHHSIDKAIRIAGLSECIQRKVPLNALFQIDSAQLKSMVGRDIRKGLHPWLVVASAGTTDVGAIDPLENIAEIAKRFRLWYHLDAAYGGFFLLTQKGKQQLKGISSADSIVMDPHKGLFLPYGSGALLVKNEDDLIRSFQYQAGYMQDARDSGDEISPAEISPELSRHFRGLRMWLPIQLHGLKPFRAALEEKKLLARYFYDKIKKLGFETGPEPELSVVIYRYIPSQMQDDPEAVNEFNHVLMTTILEDGRIFISSTLIGDIYWLRLAVLSFRTHLEHIDLLLEMLKEKTEFDSHAE